MKNLTPAQAARLVTYSVGVGLGAFMTVWGIVHNDAALITAGLGLIGTGGLAGSNVSSGGKYAK